MSRCQTRAFANPTSLDTCVTSPSVTLPASNNMECVSFQTLMVLATQYVSVSMDGQALIVANAFHTLTVQGMLLLVDVKYPGNASVNKEMTTASVISTTKDGESCSPK